MHTNVQSQPALTTCLLQVLAAVARQVGRAQLARQCRGGAGGYPGGLLFSSLSLADALVAADEGGNTGGCNCCAVLELLLLQACHCCCWSACKQNTPSTLEVWLLSLLCLLCWLCCSLRD